MMKSWKKITWWVLTSFFSISFLLLLLKRVSDYQISFIKFSLVNFIYENKLSNLYYVLGTAELLLLSMIFFIHRHWAIKAIVDLALLVYISCIVAYYLVLLK